MEIKKLKEEIDRVKANLEVESGMRRKHEQTIRELQEELKISENQLKQVAILFHCLIYCLKGVMLENQLLLFNFHAAGIE